RYGRRQAGAQVGALADLSFDSFVRIGQDQDPPAGAVELPIEEAPRAEGHDRVAWQVARRLVEEPAVDGPDLEVQALLVAVIAPGALLDRMLPGVPELISELPLELDPMVLPEFVRGSLQHDTTRLRQLRVEQLGQLAARIDVAPRDRDQPAEYRGA